MKIDQVHEGKRKEDDKFAFFLQEILSTSISGVYISNLHLFAIAKKLDLDVTLRNQEMLLSEMFRQCEEKGLLEPLISELALIVQARRTKYDILLREFPQFAAIAHGWSQKARSMLQKLSNTAMQYKGATDASA